MRHNLILSFLGWMTAALSAMMLLPIFTALIAGEVRALFLFMGAAMISGFTSGLMILAGRQSGGTLTHSDLCLFTFLGWMVASAIGSFPLWLVLNLPIAQAYFLAASALTTTGASIFTNLELIPLSVKLWLAFMQWIGGAATIIMAMMVLAPLGIGGMSLRQIAGTANQINPQQSLLHALRVVLPIYAIFTLLCCVMLLLGGVSLFDALCLSFSTLSTGGMNLVSEGWVLSSPYVKFVLAIFMLIGAMNMAQYYYLIIRRNYKFSRDLERKVFLILLAIVALVLMGFLFEERQMGDEAARSIFAGGWGEILLDERWRNALGEGLFAAISVMSTTGWHSPGLELPFIFTLLLTFIGGMTLSTAGGVKLMRILLLLRQSRRELSVIAYPHDVKGVYFDGRAIHINLMMTVWVFFALFNLSIAILMLAFAMTGLSFEHALAAAVAAISNAGPMVSMIGIDGVALYANLPEIGNWVMSLGMIAGRVELMLVLSLFSPIFWKK